MKLSVLIRNLNEAERLEATLQSLRLQQVNFEYEVVVIDNESTDHSVAIARHYGCEVHSMKRSEFTYGRAINYGMEICKGEIVLLLSAHVLLLGKYFLSDIVQYFMDPQVVFARPVDVRKGKLVKASCQFSELIWPSHDNDLAVSDFVDRQWGSMLIAHCSAVRKLVTAQVRFDEDLEANEDKLWSIEVLKRGWKGVCNIPLYYFYTKELSYKNRLEIDYKELKSKAYILNRKTYHSTRIGFVLRSFIYAVRTFWPRVIQSTRLAIRLAMVKNKQRVI